MNQALITDVSFGTLRLPYNDALADSYGIDNVGWKVLVDTIFPNATSVDSIIMALTYCRKRNLDIFKRPVHIVPMWSSAANNGKGGMIDTIWPGISELRTTAFRTGSYAGRDETLYGPDVTKKVGNVEITFPEWAQITVYRIVSGLRCAFYGPRVYWLEAYAQQKQADASPNAMWKKRPHGQIEKCAEAGALRTTFPEEIGNEYAAEEMEGQRLFDADNAQPERRAPVAPPAQQSQPALIEHNPEEPMAATEPEKPKEEVPAEQQHRAPSAPPKVTEPKPGLAKVTEQPKPAAVPQEINYEELLTELDTEFTAAKTQDELVDLSVAADEAWHNCAPMAIKARAGDLFDKHSKRIAAPTPIDPASDGTAGDALYEIAKPEARKGSSSFKAWHNALPPAQWSLLEANGRIGRLREIAEIADDTLGTGRK